MPYAHLAAALKYPSDSDWETLPPHPRILADQPRFDALKAQNDPVSQQLKRLLKNEAEQTLAADAIVYPSQGFMLSAMREAQGRILTLAMVYRLTGDKRCLERARAELRQLADLPHWYPAHFLDAGEAALAAGIGLDWLYDDLSSGERDHIAQAIVRNALLPSLEAAEGDNSWVNGDFNWNPVCHAGLLVGALAIAEQSRHLVRQIVDRAIKNIPAAEATYAPDGSYPEGPSYWSYGTTFQVILVETLRSVFGTSYGLGMSPGFLKTADFSLQMVGPSGEDYNFADYHVEYLHEPVMLWFARELQRPELAKVELHDLAQRDHIGRPRVRSCKKYQPSPGVGISLVG